MIDMKAKDHIKLKYVVSKVWKEEEVLPDDALYWYIF